VGIKQNGGQMRHTKIGDGKIDSKIIQSWMYAKYDIESVYMSCSVFKFNDYQKKQ